MVLDTIPQKVNKDEVFFYCGITRTDNGFHNNKIPHKIFLGKFYAVGQKKEAFVTPRNEVSHTANHSLLIKVSPSGRFRGA